MDYLKQQRSFVLKNYYFAVRHGQSKGNIENRVVSNPLHAINDFSLTKTGEKQVVNSAVKFFKSPAQSWVSMSRHILISSPFARAHYTATLFRMELKKYHKHWAPISFDDFRLRERWFGDFDMKTPSNELYPKVWAEDGKNPKHKKFGVESCHEVAKRVATLIHECEDRFDDCVIYLFSHGDTLQITQTIFANISPARHRELPHLETAQIRELVAASE